MPLLTPTKIFSWLLKLGTLGAVAGLLASTCVAAENDFIDKDVGWHDTGIIPNRNSTSVHWLNTEIAYLQAETKFGRFSAPKDSEPYVAMLNISTGKVARVPLKGALVCIIPNSNKGVFGLRETRLGPSELRFVTFDDDGQIQLTEAHATISDCLSVQEAKLQKGQFRIGDMEPGRGLFIQDTLNKDPKTGTPPLLYVTETGKAFPLPFNIDEIGGPDYVSWANKIFITQKGSTYWWVSPEGDVSGTPAHIGRELFTWASTTILREGLFIEPGVRDPYVGGWFYVPNRLPATRYRIYRKRGYANGASGPTSVSPDGCTIVTTQAADGFLNQLKIFDQTSVQTVHYANLCNAFNPE